MATWNVDKPAMGNQISADVPDIEENFQELHDVVEAITQGTLGTTTAANFRVNSLVDVGYYNRTKFTYKDADEIYLEPAVYDISGKGMVKWDLQLTFAFGSGGSNAASDDLTASAWHYLYLDYSAITEGTAITNAMLLNDTTAPSWTVAKHGWYNSDDRCIGAFITNGSSQIVEFFHDGGDLVVYADKVADRPVADLNTTWIDVTLTIPGFSTKAQCTFSMGTGVDAETATGYWRTNGQTGTTGHNYGYVHAAASIFRNTTNVITDSSQKIEVKHSAANAATTGVDTDGYYFPIGM